MANEDKSPLATKPAAAPTPDAEPSKRAYLTTDYSAKFGPQGRFVDLTEAEFAAEPEGLLIVPTPEQLARRKA